MNRITDVFIPTIPKDIVQLQFAIDSLRKHVPNIGKIHITSPQLLMFNGGTPDDIILHCDMHILPNTQLNLCSYRKNWIFQQLLKLLQDVTTTDYTLVFDSDNILVNDLNIFTDDGQPIQYIGEYQNHKPYFDFISLMSGGMLGREYDASFICDLGLFKRDIINEMLERFHFTKDSFIDFTLKNSSPNCHISEYELYGNYVEKYHNGLYHKKQIKSIQHMKMQYNPYQISWTPEEISNIINSVKGTDCEILHIRSGCTNSNLTYQ